MKKLLPDSTKKSIFILRERLSELEKERIDLEDEIANDSKRIELAKKQWEEKPVLLDLSEIMDKLNANIESNMLQLKKAKIKRKKINKYLEETRQLIANKKEFKQINETELERDERLVSDYYTLIREMCAPPPFPDQRMASQANWIIASKNGGDVTPELFEMMDNLHRFKSHFLELDTSSKIDAFKQIQVVKKEMNKIIREYVDLTNLETLKVDLPRINIDKRRCAQDYTYLKLSIDRIFWEPKQKSVEGN